MSASPAAPRRAAMPFILIAVLIDMVSIGLIVPVLPALVGSFTGSQADQAFWFGAVSLAFGVANFFGAPLLGALSDQLGRRPVLLLGFGGLAISFFGSALAPSLTVLLAVRLVSGGLQANVAVAQAYVADISTPEEKARRFGLLGAMFGLGFILGPVMGGLLGALHLHLPFWVAGALAVTNSLYGFFVLPESLPAERRQPFSWARANPVAALRRLGQLQGVGALVVTLGLASLVQFTMHSAWVLYTQFKFGWGPRENGWSLFAVGLMAALVQGGLMRVLLKRFAPSRLAVLGLLSSACAYAGWGAASEGWMMYLVIGLNVLGFTTTSALQSIVSNAADGQSQGRTLGALAALQSLMAVIAPIIGASLLGLVSHLPQGDWRIGLPFFFCAAVQGLGAFVAWRHFRAQPVPAVSAAA